MGHILNNAEKFEAGIAFGCAVSDVKPKTTPRYFIPAGTICRVTKITKIDWQEYRTKEDLSFERFERYDSSSKEYEFRSKAWLVQVWRGKVKHREDIRFSRSDG